VLVRRPLHSRLQQGSKFAEDFIARVVTKAASKFSLSRAPIQTLYLVGQNHTANRKILRQSHFKGIALHLTRNRTEQSETDLSVVRLGRDDNGRSPPSLLVARLRIQADPNDITTLGYVCHLWLPGLPPKGLPNFDFGMPVPRRHFRNERSQLPPWPNG